MVEEFEDDAKIREHFPIASQEPYGAKTYGLLANKLSPRRMTTREQLTLMKGEMMQRLNDIDRAINELDNNPDAESLINALQKVGVY